MKKGLRTLLTFALGLGIQSAPLSAFGASDEITADLVRVSTPTLKPNFAEFSPPEGKYTYTVGWEGIPAATCTVTVTREPEDNRYRVIATAKTYSGIDLLYKLRYRGEGLMDEDTLAPQRTVIDMQENSRVKNAQLMFTPEGRVHAVRTTKGKDSNVVDFQTDNFTLDPFSSVFIARGVDWYEGARYQFDTFNGKSRYLITLTATGKETIKVNGERREAWIIEPTVANLTRPSANKKLRSAKVYLTADSRREVVRVKSSVFIGSVFADLESFEPSAPYAPPMKSPIQLVQRLNSPGSKY